MAINWLLVKFLFNIVLAASKKKLYYGINIDASDKYLKIHDFDRIIRAIKTFSLKDYILHL